MGLPLIPCSYCQVRCPSDRERALTEPPLRMVRDHSPPPPSPHTATGCGCFEKVKFLKGHGPGHSILAKPTQKWP